METLYTTAEVAGRLGFSRSYIWVLALKNNISPTRKEKEGHNVVCYWSAKNIVELQKLSKKKSQR